MSHPSNEEFLERTREEFLDADSKEERQKVVARLRNEGFTAQANFLSQYTEEGMDESTL
jgi:hypothetical protein